MHLKDMQLQLLRLELKETNARISQEAKDVHLAVEKKDKELESLYKHATQQEKSAGKQIREYQDLALTTRREQQNLKAQFLEAKKQISDINKINKNLVLEKQELFINVEQTAAALTAQGESMEQQLEQQLEVFQQHQAVMVSQYQEKIETLQTDLTIAKSTRPCVAAAAGAGGNGSGSTTPPTSSSPPLVTQPTKLLKGIPAKIFRLSQGASAD